MTVATQLEQAIANIQSAAASMKTFAVETEDQQAKQTFQHLAPDPGQCSPDAEGQAKIRGKPGASIQEMTE